PWIGVMAVGYAFGSLYQKDGSQRRRWLLWIGVIGTWLFIFIRAMDVYGDPAHWSRQRNVVFTVLSFLNTTKYPPSLQFLLMTLGPSILALAWFERISVSLMPRACRPQRLRNALITFCRLPLFFFLLQCPTALGISMFLH